MKLSEINKELINSLTPRQLWNVVCGGIVDDGASAEYAIVLGGNSKACIERASAAAELYHTGRVKYFIPSGGVEHPLENGDMILETNHMKRVLLDRGVPNNSILIEDQARTTKENMICSVIVMNRKTPSYPNKDVIIVSSISHLQRARALAETFLPRMMKIHLYPVYPKEDLDTWLSDEKHIKSLKNCIRLTKDLINQGIIEDIEIGDIL